MLITSAPRFGTRSTRTSHIADDERSPQSSSVPPQPVLQNRDLLDLIAPYSDFCTFRSVNRLFNQSASGHVQRDLEKLEQLIETNNRSNKFEDQNNAYKMLLALIPRCVTPRFQEKLFTILANTNLTPGLQDDIYTGTQILTIQRKHRTPVLVSLASNPSVSETLQSRIFRDNENVQYLNDQKLATKVTILVSLASNPNLTTGLQKELVACAIEMPSKSHQQAILNSLLSNSQLSKETQMLICKLVCFSGFFSLQERQALLSSLASHPKAEASIQQAILQVFHYYENDLNKDAARNTVEDLLISSNAPAEANREDLFTQADSALGDFDLREQYQFELMKALVSNPKVSTSVKDEIKRFMQRPLSTENLESPEKERRQEIRDKNKAALLELL